MNTRGRRAEGRDQNESSFRSEVFAVCDEDRVNKELVLDSMSKEDEVEAIGGGTTKDESREDWFSVPFT